MDQALEIDWYFWPKTCKR